MDKSRANRRGLGSYRVKRRTVLTGAGAALGTLFLPRLPAFGASEPTRSAAAEPKTPVSEPTRAAAVKPKNPAYNPTRFDYTPPAKQKLLVNPNKGNELAISLPLAANGGVPSTYVLPLAGMIGAVQTRTLSFRQPFTGALVNPNLANLRGRHPIWGAKGNGSTDVVQIETRDGKTWSVAGNASTRRTTGRSFLEAAPGAPAASADPMSLPNPILEWSAADMYATTANGTTFGPGAVVGQDFSGSGNAFIVNPGETMTFHKTQLSGTHRAPSGMPPFPWLAGSGSRQGIGCTFHGGPVSAWSILIAFSPSDKAGGGVFDEEQVFSVRPTEGNGLLFALKYGNMGYTYDGDGFNNLFWNSNPFATRSAVPSVMGWSVSGGQRLAMPSVVAGSLSSPVASANSSTGVTTAPRTISGMDIHNAYAICAVVVYATALTTRQLQAVSRRLAFVGYGGTA